MNIELNSFTVFRQSPSKDLAISDAATPISGQASFFMQNFTKDAYSFSDVRLRELEFVSTVRKATGRNDNSPHVGLAFSGGGIRSATFQLGLLQALASSKILEWVDYLSSVSGGGYISGWLMKWLKAEGREKVFSQLNVAPGRSEPLRIQWLRRHSSFLTPHPGLFGRGSIFLATNYIHSLLFNLLIFLFFFASLLFFPRLSLASIMPAGGGTILRHVNLPFNASNCLEIIGGGLALGSVFVLVLSLLDKRDEHSRLGTPYQMLVGAGILILVIVMRLAHLSFIRWFIAPVLVVALFWRRNREIAVIFFTGVLLCFLMVLDFSKPGPDHVTMLCPHWPEIVFAAWMWAVAVDTWTVIGPGFGRVPRLIVVLPAFVSSFLITDFMFYRSDLHAPEKIWVRHDQLSKPLIDNGMEGWVLVLSVIVLGLILSPLLSPNSDLRIRAHKFISFIIPKRVRFGAKYLLAALFAVLIAAVLLFQYPTLLHAFPKLRSAFGEGASLHILAIMPPLCLAIGTLGISLMVALLGNLISPFKRERVWAFCATMYHCIFLWSALVLLSIYVPALVATRSYVIRWSLASVWLLSIPTAFMRERAEKSRGFKSAVAIISPYIFLFGLLTAIAIWDNTVLKMGGTTTIQDYFGKLLQSCVDPATAIYSVVLMALAVGLASRLGVNMSSMHYFYQGRLAKAYLSERLPGFVPSSKSFDPIDLPAEEPSFLDQYVPESPIDGRSYLGPYPIFNATLNLGSGNDVNGHERKGANFVFTPLFSGYDPALATQRMKPETAEERAIEERGLERLAYAETSKFKYDRENSIRLAAAMAISGSAISSAMGEITTARSRLLHTLLNLRLGWWLPNPRYPRAWYATLIRQRTSMLIDELFGWMTDRGPYIHLSDGGHFENLGLYELAQRQCDIIILSDASEDRAGNFHELRLAIEKCRIDFNYIVELDLACLYGTNGTCEECFTIGSINYGSSRNPGLVIYLRPAITTASPFYLRVFQRADNRFPNHPTRRQWFNESEFEGYRELGYQAGMSLLRQLGAFSSPEEFLRRCTDLKMGDKVKASAAGTSG